jgi:hypothetical protein
MVARNGFEIDDSKDGDENESSAVRVNMRCGYRASLSLSEGPRIKL